MLKHARKTLHTVKRSARQYSTSSKDDSIASSLKAFDVVYYGTFIGTGASSIYGVWSIITSSLTPINEKLEKLDAKLDASEARLEARIGKLDEKVEKLDANVNYIKGYLRIQEIAPQTNDGS